MFAKLLKYEWKSTSRLLGIFSLAAVLAGALGALALRFIIGYATGITTSAGEQEQVVEAIAVSSLSMLLFFVVLALVAYYLGTQIVLLYRFYKSKFTDEGYLTFTLPVRNQEIVLSAWLNMLIWSAISGLIVAASAAVMSYCATKGLEDFFLSRDMLDMAKEMFGDTIAEYGGAYYILSAISSVLDWLTAPLITMTCITIGAVGAKKHKILLAIAIYYGYSMVTGIVETVLTSVVEILAFTTETHALTELSLMVGVLVHLLLGALCWFLTNHLMSKKLNLP